jgi:hypothetical protein
MTSPTRHHGVLLLEAARDGGRRMPAPATVGERATAAGGENARCAATCAAGEEAGSDGIQSRTHGTAAGGHTRRHPNDARDGGWGRRTRPTAAGAQSRRPPEENPRRAERRMARWAKKRAAATGC